MEGTLIVGAVAEKGDDNLAVLLLLGGKRRTDGDRNAAADDTVGAEIALGDVGNMHRAASALAVSGLLAEELCEHFRDFRALGDTMAMAAMGRGDQVILAERQGNADRTGFLADRKMHCAVNEATRIGFLRTLFEAADEVHLAQGFLQLFRGIMPEREGKIAPIILSLGI